MELSNQSIERYIKASIHLYGVVSISDLQSTIYHYTKEKINREKIEEVIGSMITDKTELQRHRHYLYSDTYLEVRDVPYFYTKIQQDKPFYRPEKLEFLRYVTGTYFELTPTMKEFKVYLVKDLKISEYVAENILKQTVYNIQASVDMKEIITDLQTLLSFDKLNINVLMRYIANMNNTTRMVCHRGHTPLELRQYKKVLS